MIAAWQSIKEHSMTIRKQVIEVVLHVDDATCSEQAVECGHDIENIVSMEIPILELPRHIRRIFQVDGIYPKLVRGLTDGTNFERFCCVSLTPTVKEAIDGITSSYAKLDLIETIKFDANGKSKVKMY